MNLKNLLHPFVQLGLTIIFAKFREDWTIFVTCGEDVLLILTIFKLAAKF